MNAREVGLGVVLITLEEETLPMAKRLDFKMTNNMVEYKACLFVIEVVVVAGAKHLMVYKDSMLVIQQALEEWKVNEERLRPYVNYLKTLVWNFSKCSFVHLPQDENQMADALATLLSMWVNLSWLLMKPLMIMKLGAPCYQGDHTMQVQIGLEEKPWFYDLKKFIESREYPEEATVKERYALRIQARNYISHEEVLYRRMVSGVQLRCVTKAEAQVMMEKMHKGVCGPHMHNISLNRKIMRQGYYWLIMEKDCIALMRRCRECQLYSDLSLVFPIELHNLMSP
ncbi:uncharacterized protein LOC107260964 [Ricinus communis]|uniref:uncharacterized protein LOC107260964 n=1 Tax=Ricinus communis TaxID=3988 RepID=UPI00077237F9|nr:uncharacterized protein LOC107260964 [Ricinus communis]|eukprot:XP_015572655.1 uncharacterized protein LOC107260964 [Ricinus communis]